MVSAPKPGDMKNTLMRRLLDRLAFGNRGPDGPANIKPSPGDSEPNLYRKIINRLG